MSYRLALHATNRFGLGPTTRDLESVARDPVRWTRNQIQTPVTPADLSGFPHSSETLTGMREARMANTPEMRQQETRKYRETVIQETMARARAMITTDKPFAERMVLFWSNHFTVSRTKGIVGPIAPAYEREVIRPNVFGRFSDLLIAVCRHPAMLLYLDNHLSIGENSRAGKRRRRRTGADKTLNENLAREILELHTLGVNGGYSQNDVIELAKAISGWSHGGTRLKFEKEPTHGNFEFKSIFHEPGKKTVLGKTYTDDGAEQGVAILRD
ncbi:MAG: DUF1800 family protein, partial [Pseudomonadota bacterium]